ncbi:MAG: helix-turn-helix transcriptional regulator [Lachnospiraceae bacterium]
MKLSLSENISSLRRASGLTQERLAEALGVSFAAVSKWERGGSLIKIPHQSHADFCSTDTAGGLDNKKRRYAPREGSIPPFLVGVSKGGNAPIWHTTLRSKVLCYTLCRRCRENAVAAGEGKGI